MSETPDRTPDREPPEPSPPPASAIPSWALDRLGRRGTEDEGPDAPAVGGNGGQPQAGPVNGHGEEGIASWPLAEQSVGRPTVTPIPWDGLDADADLDGAATHHVPKDSFLLRNPNPAPVRPASRPASAEPLQRESASPLAEDISESLAQPSESFLRSAEGAIKIGLWGSPASGKTTYLAALRHAVGVGAAGYGSWTIYPCNPQSKELMVRFTHTLVTERQFPPPTFVGASVPLQWLFVGDLAKTQFDHRWLRRGTMESRFLLDLIDVNGGAFADRPDNPRVASEALRHLTDAEGLIFLFDPIRERERRDSSNYVNNTIAELSARYLNRGNAKPHLPHHVAVCVTKFDHPRVFQQARELGFVNNGEDGMPRVLDEHAEQFFDALCSGDFWSELDEGNQASAMFVRQELRRVFDPKNIRYYVTSSIGFRQPPRWSPAADSRFDPRDFANYYEANGQTGIRGAIRPINVLEPLITLTQRIGKQG